MTPKGQEPCPRATSTLMRQSCPAAGAVGVALVQKCPDLGIPIFTAN